MMAEYKYLLLDADNTLLDFDRAEETAFYASFSASGLFADEAIYTRYHEINDDLWRKLERNEVTRERLVDLRFEILLSEIGLCDDSLTKSISRTYFTELGKQRFLLSGAVDVCRTLSASYPLYIVTNGNYDTQVSRFQGSGVEMYFQEIFVSEKVGASKPSPAFFEYVMETIGDKDPSHYLIVGDSLTSDIDGARAVGIDAVWLDRSGNYDTRGREVSYMINDIRELPKLIDRITEK